MDTPDIVPRSFPGYHQLDYYEEIPFQVYKTLALTTQSVVWKVMPQLKCYQFRAWHPETIDDTDVGPNIGSYVLYVFAKWKVS